MLFNSTRDPVALFACLITCVARTSRPLASSIDTDRELAKMIRSYD